MRDILEMVGITKEFSGVIANNKISLSLAQGEVLALLGENGAGKSTLMNILFGLCQPDSGTIHIKGRPVKISSPLVAGQLGIGMAHQHFNLIHHFTVTENIILGMEPLKYGFLSLKKATEKVKELSELYSLGIDPQAKIEDISVGMQQRISILKMLYRSSDILIFDEPTAVLTPQEITEFIKILRHLQNKGKSIIFITHKIKEIKAIAHRCTIIRKGRVVQTIDVATTSVDQMAEMMIGHPIAATSKTAPRLGPVILSIQNLHVRNKHHIKAIKNLSLEIRSGEIVGIAGIAGNGQTELIKALSGLCPCESGTLLMNGQDITHASVRQRIEAGIAHIPEDRQKRGLILDFSLQNNLILKNHYRQPFSQKGFLKFNDIKNYSKKIIELFHVSCGKAEDSLAEELSGGNQQKVIIGREINLNPDLLLAVQPTRGLDIGSIEYIHQFFIEQRNKGKAILFVSFELEELMKLSDRIAVLFRGELVGIEDTMTIDENKVGLMMTGTSEGQIS